jgi:hypothetical protein
MKFKATETQSFNINVSALGNLNISQDATPIMTLKSNGEVEIKGTGALRIPSGNETTDKTLIIPQQGLIRYNTHTHEFEGYGEEWGGLGGVKTSSGHTTITAHDSNGLEFFTSDVKRMTILADGKVGIGAGVPNAKLDIEGYDSNIYFSSKHNMTRQYSVNFDSYFSQFHNSIIRYADTQTGFVGNGEPVMNKTHEIEFGIDINSKQLYEHDYYDSYYPTRHGMYFKLSNAGSSSETPPLETKMSIISNGNVGIGTTSPQALLHIHKTNTASSNLDSEVDGNKVRLKITGSGANASPGIELYEDAGENGIATPNTVNGSILKYDGKANLFKINMVESDLEIEAIAIMRTNRNVGIGETSPAEKLHVAGNTVVTGDITAYYSDERLKTFKGKITEPLDKIKQLNGYYFVENELAKSLGYDNDKLQVGVSAQEVEKVLPEIVTKAPIDNKYKTVWYQKLTPLLIEGMKEQQTQIETQQTQIETQQTQIESLQKQIDELKALINK